MGFSICHAAIFSLVALDALAFHLTGPGTKNTPLVPTPQLHGISQPSKDTTCFAAPKEPWTSFHRIRWWPWRLWRMLGHMGSCWKSMKKSDEKHIFLYGSYICAHRQFWNDTCVYLQLRHGEQPQIGQAWWRSRKQTTNFPKWHNLQNFCYTCSAIKSYRKSADSLRFQPDLQLSPFAPARWGDLWFRSSGDSGMLVKLSAKPEKLFIFQNVMLHPTKVQ